MRNNPADHGLGIDDDQTKYFDYNQDQNEDSAFTPDPEYNYEYNTDFQ